MSTATLDPRLTRAIELLRVFLPEGVEVVVLDACNARLTQADGTLSIVRLQPSTGFCEFRPLPSPKGNAFAHRFGNYSPATGWRLLPVFLKPAQRRLDPGNFDNIYSL